MYTQIEIRSLDNSSILVKVYRNDIRVCSVNAITLADVVGLVNLLVRPKVMNDIAIYNRHHYHHMYELAAQLEEANHNVTRANF